MKDWQREKLLEERQRKRKLADNALDDAEAVVGERITRPGRKAGWPEEILGEAARRLRKIGTPYAKDLADDCTDLADWPKDAIDYEDDERDDED